MKVPLFQSHHVAPQTPLFRSGPMGSLKLVTIVAIGIATITAVQVAQPRHVRHNSSQGFHAPFSRRMEEIDIDTNCTVECCQAWKEEVCGVEDNESSWISAIPFGVQILMIVILLSFSALFSGLTLGIMSLDTTGLEIVMSGDDPEAAANAKVIYPVRQDGNLLLCTLLLGNVMVNALLSILMAEYTGGTVGLFSSTLLIVVFGEILPQAIVSKLACRISI